METTTEKPVLDVKAPGVRVAVYAPTWEGAAGSPRNGTGR